MKWTEYKQHLNVFFDIQTGAAWMMPVRALLRLVFKNVHQQLTINCFLINTDVRLKLSKHK